MVIIHSMALCMRATHNGKDYVIPLLQEYISIFTKGIILAKLRVLDSNQRLEVMGLTRIPLLQPALMIYL